MINVSPWNALLQEYVDRFGRVDYDRWQREQPDEIGQWLATLELNPRANADEQLALWINLYNAFTIESILERYPIPSILPTILGLPNWLAFLWFFARRKHHAFNQSYSLSQIEHQILRKQLRDPRIHFAIVCASIGCPLLRNEAYDARRVRQQLEDDAQRFMHNPDKVRYDAQRNVLYCSKILKWYRKDFLAVSPSIPDYVGSYLNQPLKAEASIVYLDYDWSLNQRISS
jgi:hypothetical protein